MLPARVGGTHRRTTTEAVNEALSSHTDQPISLDGVPFSGRTDPAIIEAVLAHNDLPTTDAMIEAVITTYVDTMRGALRPADVEVLPGVSPLLPRLDDHPDAHLGLVTGNVEPIAYEKLGAQGLADYFPVGAFGSDHAERNRLPALATRRARNHAGRAFRIECARAAGARVVAVCTGRYSRDELSPHAPDLLLDTLPAPDAFLQRVLDL
ncbi:MAG: HAD family hydrolase [Bacteroidetes bacterium QH_1_64_81]|nr:MAG: HAD family hydrolase [Bacteroidetes bacterium QH_1_64_81]